MYCNTKGILPVDTHCLLCCELRRLDKQQKEDCRLCCTESTQLLLSTLLELKYSTKYSRTPIIWINWDDDPSGYAENPDNWYIYNQLFALFTVFLSF
jgi:hypothetical protein